MLSLVFEVVNIGNKQNTMYKKVVKGAESGAGGLAGGGRQTARHGTAQTRFFALPTATLPAPSRHLVLLVGAGGVFTGGGGEKYERDEGHGGVNPIVQRLAKNKKSVIISLRRKRKHMKDLYDIDKNTVLDIIEKYDMRFRVVLDKKKELLAGEYKIVPSWLRFQIEMKSRGKKDLLAEIEDIDNTYLLDRMQNEVMEALQKDDTERLKAIQLATQTLVNKEKLGGSYTEEDGSVPMSMTINVSGISGKKEK